jgi:hypothetical protein
MRPTYRTREHEHECDVCGHKFDSGRALGGHLRWGCLPPAAVTCPGVDKETQEEEARDRADVAIANIQQAVLTLSIILTLTITPTLAPTPTPTLLTLTHPNSGLR